jgi:hypothetical protein
MKHTILAIMTLASILIPSIQVEARSFKADNIERLYPLIQDASHVTGVDPWLLSGMISWETDGVLVDGLSIRGGQGDRHWGPGQVACTPQKGKFSWRKHLRNWHKDKNLRCRDLLRPEVGVLSSAYVFRFLKFEIAFRRLDEIVREKDRTVFLYIHSRYREMVRNGYLDPEEDPEFFDALNKYDVQVSDRDVLAHYSKGNRGPEICRRSRCDYVENVFDLGREAVKDFSFVQESRDNVCMLRNVSAL